MKSEEEIKSSAEKRFPYNPYDNQFFPHTRSSNINGYIKGYKDCMDDVKKILSEILNSETPLSNLKELLDDNQTEI